MASPDLEHHRAFLCPVHGHGTDMREQAHTQAATFHLTDASLMRRLN